MNNNDKFLIIVIIVLLIFLINSDFEKSFGYEMLSEVEIQKDSEIQSNKKILLGDIAKIKSTDPVFKEKLENVIVDEEPLRSGDSRILSSKEISMKLRKTRNETSQVNWIIPSQIKLMTPYQLFSSEEIKSELLQRFSQLCMDCKFEFIQLHIPKKIPQGFFYKLPEFNELPKGSFTFPLNVNESSQYSTSSYQISGVVKILKLVPVAKRSLKSGEKISEKEIEYEYRDTTYASDIPMDKNQFVNIKMNRHLSKGQIIWQRYLTRDEDVKINENVKIVMGEPGWLITLTGIAQQKGYLGDVIKVMNSHSKKILVGEIIEKGVVKIK